MNVTEKIISSHLVSGEMIPGTEIGMKIDQTLTHDVTGTLAYLAFETMGIEKVRTDLSVSYIDHNLLQIDFKNMDDHMYLKSVAKKYGITLSRAGNGICHSVHYQRFGLPGSTLMGSDSHTPTTGGLGVLTIGAGGLDVAMGMAGEPYYFTMPEIINVKLEGKLKPGVAPKDIILELLRRMSVKGGLGKVMEYTGSGIKYLSVPDRATITNMGAELGATSSIFPSDDVTKAFLIAQDREEDFVELLPDPSATYSETILIDLDELEPLVAKPEMPDNVSKVSEVRGVKVDQVFIGSCTNASYSDIVKAAKILKGHVVHPDVSLSIGAGTRQTFQELIRDGYIQDLITSGARIMECGCSACVGIGQAPNTGGVSVRTSNRNFKGRSGTLDASVYLASPETAAATAITGVITDPRQFDCVESLSEVVEPSKYMVDDSMFISIPHDSSEKVYSGPNIKKLPMNKILEDNYALNTTIKLGENITTDDIIPAGSVFSSLRSNVPEISKITFGRIDPEFIKRVKKANGTIIVAGENYGQGSSREHAAVAPMYLGVKVVLAKSIARIHKANLINFGILPLTFKDKADHGKIDQEDTLTFNNLRAEAKEKEITVFNETKGESYKAILDVSDREVEMLLAGGKLNYVRVKNQK